MENKSTVVQVGIKYGLITGVIVIVYTVLLYLIGEAMNMWLGFLSFIFIITLMIFGMKEYKRNQEGYLEFKEGLAIGTLIVAISSLLSQIFNYVYMNFIDPSMIEQIGERTREMMEKFGMDEDKIEQAVTEAQSKMASPLSILWGILGALVMGFIISLIISAIMQNKRSEIDTLDVR